jgi:hypothetical protein
MLNSLAMLAVFLADAQQHITADNPLPVKIVKDGVDWATRANWALVIVGIGGILAAIWTLRYIRRQADLMELQTTILKDSVVAAQRSADIAHAQAQMIKDKERARLRIDFDDLDLTPSSEPGVYLGAYLVRYRLILDGSTQAYLHGGDCFAGIRVDGGKIKTRDERTYWIDMMAPDVITPERRVIEGFIPLLEEDFYSTIEDPDERIMSIREGKQHVYCEGWIVYQDVFGGQWEFGFQKKWAYFTASTEASVRLRGRWQNYVGAGTNPDANTEHSYPQLNPS